MQNVGVQDLSQNRDCFRRSSSRGFRDSDKDAALGCDQFLLMALTEVWNTTRTPIRIDGTGDSPVKCLQIQSVVPHEVYVSLGMTAKTFSVFAHISLR